MNDSSTVVLVRHPRVVVCVPCFNEEKWLERTLQSVRDQRFTDFAVLICDNASTDRTGEVARRFVALDPRFHYHCWPENLGASANFNFARAASDSPFLVWVGAHDLLHPLFLFNHVEVLEKCPALSLSQSAHDWIDEHDRPVERVDDLPLSGGGPDDMFRFLKSVGANRNNIGANSLIRRSMLEGAAFSTVLGTDRILLSHLAYRGPFGTAPEVLYLRRTFSDDRGGWQGYMERLAGLSGYAGYPDWTEMARVYDRHFHSLIGDGPRQRSARFLLQALLRYYLPVAPTSLATRGLWLLRRSVKLVTTIGRGAGDA